MQEQNLMEINSPLIGVMDTVAEYHRLFINQRVGEITRTVKLKTQRSKIFNCKLENSKEIWEVLEDKYECYSISEYKMFILEENFIATLTWLYQSSYIGINLSVLGKSIRDTKEQIVKIEQTLEKFLFKEGTLSYTILQNDDTQELNETFYQDSLDVNFNPVALPFIKEPDRYIENFLNSKVPLLILQGEAGTGKTTFVKYLLETMQKRTKSSQKEFKVTYSFDESIFYLSDFYKRIIYDDYDVLVLEDINQVLLTNQDNGSLNPINKFLSVTDGLVSKYKKIIITTNIESKHHIEPALLRPGRCYDIIPFRKLKGVEIDNLCDSCAKELHLQAETINLSEFYAEHDNATNRQLLSNRMGFKKSL